MPTVKSRPTEPAKRARTRRRAGAALFPLRRLHDQVVDELGQRIVRHEFGDEGTLPTEPELGAELGVSRGALREAVKVLVGKGLLEVRPKTGMRVRPRSQWNLLDPAVLAWQASGRLRLRHAFQLVEFRLIVEPRASCLAAKRATRVECKAILEACARLEACVEDPPAIAATDIAFHGLIHQASHNDLLVHLGRLVGSLMSMQVEMTTEDLEAFRRGLPHHRRLAEAIARRDAREAEAISAALVQMPYDDLAERLRVRPAVRL